MSVIDAKDLIDHRERFVVPKKMEPKVDTLVSSIVGKKIYATDPRLLRVIVEWKSKRKDDDVPDNLMYNPKFVVELKHALNQSL